MEHCKADTTSMSCWAEGAQSYADLGVARLDIELDLDGDSADGAPRVAVYSVVQPGGKMRMGVQARMSICGGAMLGLVHGGGYADNCDMLLRAHPHYMGSTQCGGGGVVSIVGHPWHWCSYIERTEDAAHANVQLVTAGLGSVTGATSLAQAPWLAVATKRPIAAGEALVLAASDGRPMRVRLAILRTLVELAKRRHLDAGNVGRVLSETMNMRYPNMAPWLPLLAAVRGGTQAQEPPTPQTDAVVTRLMETQGVTGYGGIALVSHEGRVFAHATRGWKDSAKDTVHMPLHWYVDVSFLVIQSRRRTSNVVALSTQMFNRFYDAHAMRPPAASSDGSDSSSGGSGSGAHVIRGASRDTGVGITYLYGSQWRKIHECAAFDYFGAVVWDPTLLAYLHAKGAVPTAESMNVSPSSLVRMPRALPLVPFEDLCIRKANGCLDMYTGDPAAAPGPKTAAPMPVSAAAAPAPAPTVAAVPAPAPTAAAVPAPAPTVAAVPVAAPVAAPVTPPQPVVPRTTPPPIVPLPRPGAAAAQTSAAAAQSVAVPTATADAPNVTVEYELSHVQIGLPSTAAKLHVLAEATRQGMVLQPHTLPTELRQPAGHTAVGVPSLPLLASVGVQSHDDAESALTYLPRMTAVARLGQPLPMSPTQAAAVCAAFEYVLWRSLVLLGCLMGEAAAPFSVAAAGWLLPPLTGAEAPRRAPLHMGALTLMQDACSAAAAARPLLLEQRLAPMTHIRAMVRLGAAALVQPWTAAVAQQLAAPRLFIPCVTLHGRYVYLEVEAVRVDADPALVSTQLACAAANTIRGMFAAKNMPNKRWHDHLLGTLVRSLSLDFLVLQVVRELQRGTCVPAAAGQATTAASRVPPQQGGGSSSSSGTPMAAVDAALRKRPLENTDCGSDASMPMLKRQCTARTPSVRAGSVRFSDDGSCSEDASPH